MKIEINIMKFYVLLAIYLNLSSKSSNLEFFPLKSNEFGPFFHEESFELVEIIFFRSNFGKIHQGNKHCFNVK